jgi:C-terminal processing protease CtpA/Prc
MKKILILLMAFLFFRCETRPQNEPFTERSYKLNAKYIECFEGAWKRVKDVYPFLDYKKINWDSIYTVYRPKVEEANRKEFNQLLNDMLAELKDVHVYHQNIKGQQKYVYESPRQTKDKYAYSLRVIRNYFNTKLVRAKCKSVMYGITPENIGYIYFYDLLKSDLQIEFHEILKYLSNTKGLILDFRTRQGGDYQVIQSVVLNFLTTPLEKPKMFILEDIEQPPFQPLTNTFIYTKPIVAIINGITISGGELITEILKQLPNVTAVGDTTSGGGGCASGHTAQALGQYRLPCKKIIFIPTGYLLRYDGSHYEWNGVSPDIRVEQTETDIKNGKDKQLEYAINILK